MKFLISAGLVLLVMTSCKKDKSPAPHPLVNTTWLHVKQVSSDGEPIYYKNNEGSFIRFGDENSFFSNTQYMPTGGIDTTYLLNPATEANGGLPGYTIKARPSYSASFLYTIKNDTLIVSNTPDVADVTTNYYIKAIFYRLD